MKTLVTIVRRGTRKRTLFWPIILLIAAGSVMLYIFQSAANSEAMWPAYPWQVTGQVFDTSSVAISNATVTVSGTLSITAVSALTKMAPTSIHLEMATDGEGRFALTFKPPSFNWSSGSKATLKGACPLDTIPMTSLIARIKS